MLMQFSLPAAQLDHYLNQINGHGQPDLKIDIFRIYHKCTYTMQGKKMIKCSLHIMRTQTTEINHAY